MSDENTEMMTENMETQMETQNPQEAQLDLSSPEAKQLVESMVQEQLSQMKDNMNKMAKQRDDAMRKAVELEESAKAAKLEKLEAEGKTSEALQMKLDEATARAETLSKINTELTRDHSVDRVLGGLDFRNQVAKDMARQQVIAQLKQDTEGAWVHATGASISDFVQSFSKDEENAFLFKPKQSSGAAAMQQAGANNDGSGKLDKPITELSFQDYLRSAPGPGGNDFGF